ncbi:hypothetical protein SERLA73DRAFT_164092 [Serpula lacrymans var. lacrymans S7.3]|uniref:Uncharacterized protein n=1 Tax=Serpula lacrymans var. lacrymans (strain S7.3) TaxID=936435 RepID=F8QH28_SERL3|nr:hypothetical protein SERLA73DRAFT_164092 [Serpula lacrymans var. lacrymans S7.3]
MPTLLVNPDEALAYLDQLRRTKAKIEKHAVLCYEWQEAISSSRRCERRDAGRARMDAIKAWMKEHGWEKELDYFTWDQITRLSLIKEQKLLTERIWNKIRLSLINWMNKLRDIRLEETVFKARRECLISAYCEYLKQPPNANDTCDILPHVGDIATFKSFEDLIKAPVDVDVNAQSFSDAFVQLPAYVTEWRRKIEGQLVSCLLPEGTSPMSKTAIDHHSPKIACLNLARVAFCRPFTENDVSVTFYPDVLLKRCFIEPYTLRHMSDWDKWQDPKIIEIKTMNGCPWSLEDSKGRNVIEVSDAAIPIIRASGLDPDIATTSDMDDLDARFRCGSCSSAMGVIPYTWRSAVAHAVSYHDRLGRRVGKASWTVLNGEDRNENLRKTKSPPFFNRFECALCRTSVDNRDWRNGVLLHLLHEHKIPVDKVQEDVHMRGPF